MDVCVLRWPDQADEAHRLASLGTPRLLLVEPGVAPPTETSCVADWLRLPVEDQDMRARLAALSERSLRHPIAPVVDDCGGVSYRGTTVFLPEVDERIARILIGSFGHPVRNEELISRVWTEDASKGLSACTSSDSAIASHPWDSPSPASEATGTSCAKPRRQTERRLPSEIRATCGAQERRSRAASRIVRAWQCGRREIYDFTGCAALQVALARIVLAIRAGAAIGSIGEPCGVHACAMPRKSRCSTRCDAAFRPVAVVPLLLSMDSYRTYDPLVAERVCCLGQDRRAWRSATARTRASRGTRGNHRGPHRSPVLSGSNSARRVSFCAHRCELQSIGRLGA